MFLVSRQLSQQALYIIVEIYKILLYNYNLLTKSTTSYILICKQEYVFPNAELAKQPLTIDQFFNKQTVRLLIKR